MSAPLPIKITTGPHGRNTTLEINGEKVTNATEFTLNSACNKATTLTVTYINLAVEVEGLIETSGFNAVNREYKRVILKAEDEPERPDLDEDE